MQQRVVDPRMYFKVEEDMNNKAQQLKTIRAREKFLQQKLTSAEKNEEEVFHEYIISNIGLCLMTFS